MSREYNNQTFYLIGEDWNLFDEGSQSFIPLKKNELTILFVKSATPTQIQTFAESYNLNLMRQAITGWHDFMFSPSNNILVKCDSLQANAIVEMVEIITPLTFEIIPNDSAFSQYNGGTGQIYQYNLELTQITNAWNTTTGSEDIVVAFIDSGTDWWVSDFVQATGANSGTFWLNSGEDAWTDLNDPTTGNGIDDDGNGFIDDWRGWNFLANNNDVRDGWDFPHGTSVLSVVGARSNNQIGLAGVAGG